MTEDENPRLVKGGWTDVTLRDLFALVLVAKGYSSIAVYETADSLLSARNRKK